MPRRRRTFGKWAARIAVLAALAAVVARVVGARPDRDGSGASPVIGGDTWPPVPTNQARRE